MTAGLWAGVDLGGTNIAALLADDEGNVLAGRAIPTEAYRGPDDVLARMASLVRALGAEAGAQPAAVGVGVPGLVDLARGVTRFLPNLPTQWRDVRAGEQLAAALGRPVYLLNDARLATLGELTFGSGRGARSMAFFTLGTGIGGGVVIDGRLVLGRHGAAGELGHQSVQLDGPPCPCGNRGCVELYASGPAITAEGVRLLLSNQAPALHAAVAGDTGRVDIRAMVTAADAGDTAVAAALTRAAQALGAAVANVVAVLQPERVVLGGGVAAIGARLFDPVRATVHERVGKLSPIDELTIAPSALGDRAGALGGVALARMGGLIAPADAAG